jgi:two-component system sensor histidine kinase UhpB
MKGVLKILMLEDNDNDAEIIQRAVKKEKPQCIFKLVMTRESFLEALTQFEPDLILSDNTLPQFNATEALQLFNQRHLLIPFILVTGTVSEEFAASIIKLGADDYILKDRLIRLPGAIDAALQKKKTEAEIKQSEEIRRLIMNSSLDAIICLNTTGTATVWNPQAEKMFGWKEEEILGKSLLSFIIPEQQRKTLAKEFNGYLKTGEWSMLNKVVELTGLNKNGDEFPVELAITHVQKNSSDFFCAFIRDITERKKADATLKLMENKILNQKIQEQKKISRAIIKAQEAEKNHIGKELHDNISQILASTKMFLSSAAKKNDAVKDLIKYPLQLINSSIDEIRLLSHKQVTPLKNINLKQLVSNLIEPLNVNNSTQIVFSYDVNGLTVDDDLKLNIYRIIQEQLNNIIKHAAASNVLIAIKAADKSIHVIVSDDGKGFKPGIKRKGIGISNMINRIESYNGKLKIKSSPGNGCKINVEIPCCGSEV